MKLLAAAAIAAIMSTASQASITVYSNAAAFTSAAGTLTTEAFSGGPLATGLSFSSTVGNVANGKFNDRTVFGLADTTFSFASPVKAFAATFDETPGGFGQGLKFDVTDGSTTLHDAGAGTFFGFISTTAFSSVHITSDYASCCAETYNLTDLKFSAGVPEPTSWALMIAGFGLVGSALRRRSAIAAA